MSFMMPQRQILRGAKPYVGQLGTRSRIPTQTYAGSLAYSHRYYEYARDNITFLRIAHAQWDGQSNERAAGASVTWTASIEFPIGGPRYQFKFNGASSIVCPDGFTTWSDWLAVRIPVTSKYRVHQFFSGTRFPYNDGSLEDALYNDVANGDATDYSGADLTMSGTYTDGGTNSPSYAAALIGPTMRPTIGAVGDSRVMGFGDDVVANVGGMGEIMRAIGPNFGGLNCAISADTIANWTNLANTAKRRELLKFCSHIICELGASDVLNFGASAATVLANQLIVRDSFRPKPFFQTTLMPKSTGTFTSAAGQTTDAVNSVIVAANANIRSGGYFTGIADSAALIEDTPGNGKFKSTGGIARTDDGTHLNPFGYGEVQAGGLYPPTMFNLDPGATYLPGQ